MEGYQRELTEIKLILRNNPKGMTVSDISKQIKINRNSVAKYLDILLISGHVEMVTFGPAKVFFPSRRVPVCSLINYVSDCVCIVDKHMKIVQINDIFLSIIGEKRGNLLGERIDRDVDLPLTQDKQVLNQIREALEGKEHTDEISIKVNGDEYFFQLRLLPTTFDDGGQGVAIILTDITEKRRIEEALRGRFSLR